MNRIEMAMKLRLLALVVALCAFGRVEAARSPGVSRVGRQLRILRGARVALSHPYLDRVAHQLREQGLLDRAAAPAVEIVANAFMLLHRAVQDESRLFVEAGTKWYKRWEEDFVNMLSWDVGSPVCVSSADLTGQGAVARLMSSDLGAEPIGASICAFYKNFARLVFETSKDKGMGHSLAILKCFAAVVEPEFVEPVAAAYKPVVIKRVSASAKLEYLFGEVSCEPEKAPEGADWFQDDLPPYNVEEDASRPGSSASFEARLRDRPCAPTPEARPLSAEPLRSRFCSSVPMVPGCSLCRPAVFVDRVACKAPVAVSALTLGLRVPVFDRHAFFSAIKSLGDASRLVGRRLMSKKRATELRPPVGRGDKEPAIKKRREASSSGFREGHI